MKIKAFTLIDMLIGIILSAIVLSFGMKGLQYLYSTIEKNKKLQVQNLNESNLIRYLIYDAEKSDSILQNGDLLSFYKDSTIIYWRINGPQLYRNEKIIECTASLNVEINEFGLVDQLILTFKEHTFNYKKNYYSSILNRNGH